MPSYPSLLIRPRPASRPRPEPVRAAVTLGDDSPVVDVIVERLERAFDAGRLDLTCRQYGLVLAAAFPEQFGDRPLAAGPTAAAIGTADRIAVYCRRADAGHSLHHPDDAAADLLGRKNLLLGGIVNQAKFTVRGFDDEDDAEAA